MSESEHLAYALASVFFGLTAVAVALWGALKRPARDTDHDVRGLAWTTLAVLTAAAFLYLVFLALTNTQATP